MKKTNHKQLNLHTLVQNYLHSHLPAKESFIEYRFHNRIADIAWLTKKLVIEVQCSPISLSEVKQRIEDYKKLGLKTIWILHQCSFNKKIATRAEFFLRTTQTCYFTNITGGGHGYIYDQKETFKARIRTYRSPHIPIDLAKPIQNNGLLTFTQAAPRTPLHTITKRILNAYDQLLIKCLRRC